MNPAATDVEELAEVNVEKGGPNLPLPQPAKDGAIHYRYVRHDQIEANFFPNLENGYYKEGTLCWVLLSKGNKKSPQLYQRARVVSSLIPENKEDRILIQYPKGSTYHVRRSNLMPVLEHESNLILVASETSDYRRVSIVQTRPEDHFIEVGCDFGILVDSVDAKSSLGIDKSEESIRIARERYPTGNFLLGDIFEGLDVPVYNKAPLVVSIDINGNRQLNAVLKCIQLVLDEWSPRLIIVKSRELYAKMVKDDLY
jgi:hypothetical protein